MKVKTRVFKKDNINLSENKSRTNLKDIKDFYVNFFYAIYNKALKWSHSVTAKIILLLILPIVVLTYYPSRMDDYDIFYHLRFGEYFFKNKTFDLDHSIFSWTSADPEWRYGIWIGSTILYVIHSLLSFPGLYLFQWLILCGCAILYILYVKSTGDSIDIFHIFSLLVFYIALNLTAIYIKPELFTTLFFTIAVFIYFSIKTTGKNLFYIYPLLCLIWVNTHGGYLMCLGFLTLAFIGEFINHAIKRPHIDKLLMKHFLISILLSYLAVIFNPYGIDYHIGIIKSLITEEYMGVAKRVFAWIPMWGYLFPTDEIPYRFFGTAWIMVFMVISSIVTFVYAFFKKRYLDVALILLTIVLFQQGMKAARVTIFFLVFWMFLSVYLSKETGILDLRKRLSPFFMISFIIISVLIIRVSVLTLEDRSWFGSSHNIAVPASEVDYIRKFKLPAPIFNDYLIGAYLLWKLYPDYKVFIDPRYGPYWKEVGPDYFNLVSNLSSGTFRKFAEKYKFKTIVLHMRERGMISVLLGMPDWQLLYFDKAACIFVHKSLVGNLDKSILDVDLSPERFKDMSNPDMLMDMFYFYISFGEFNARKIMEYYKKNISELYIYKNFNLYYMDNLIKKINAK